MRCDRPNRLAGHLYFRIHGGPSWRPGCMARPRKPGEVPFYGSASTPCSLRCGIAMWITRSRHEKFATCEKPAEMRLGLNLQLPRYCWSCAGRRSKSSPCAHKITMKMRRSRLAELALLGQGPYRTEGWNLGGSLESPFRTDQVLSCVLQIGALAWLRVG